MFQLKKIKFIHLALIIFGLISFMKVSMAVNSNEDCKFVANEMFKKYSTFLVGAGIADDSGQCAVQLYFPSEKDQDQWEKKRKSDKYSIDFVRYKGKKIKLKKEVTGVIGPFGMSSAGALNFKAIISCRVEAMDPTFVPPIQRVDIAKETDWDGKINWKNSSLTMITYKVNKREAVDILPLSEETELKYLNTFPKSIDIHEYRDSDKKNVLGKIVFKKTKTTVTDGQLKSSSKRLEKLDGLILKDCSWVVDAQVQSD